MPIPTTTNETLRADSPGPHLPGTPTADIASRSPKEAAKDKTIPDIEHVPVGDDPRQWSRTRKARGDLNNFDTCTVDDDYSMIDDNVVDRVHGIFNFDSCVEYTKSYVKFSQA